MINAEHERSNAALQTLETLKKLMEEVHTDNTEVMRGLIYAKEDQLPLIKGDTETRVC